MISSYSSHMDVYLIPLGADRYELYCEPGEDADDSDDPSSESSPGWFSGLFGRFRIVLAQLDYRDRGVGKEREQRAWLRRVGDRLLRWLAHTVAEQRLLWRLRRHKEVQAHYPHDLSDAATAQVVRRLLQRDADRHRLWLLFHGVAFGISAPLFFFVPGPNLIAYYFAFRLVGHYLSSRGARQGLNVVTWTYLECEPLTTLRHVRELPRTERQRIVGDVAARLKLTHLSRFFWRTTDRTA